MFIVGDIVKLKGCSGEQRVTQVDVYNRTISTKYISSKYHHYDRNDRDFTLIQSKKETPMSPSLYVTDEETPRYGTLLTTDSQGRMVLEMKGSSAPVEAFDPKLLTEVMPYTVEVNLNGGQWHFQVKEGSLKKGDIVCHKLQLGKVVRINTKNKKATQASDMVKLGSTPVEL